MNKFNSKNLAMYSTLDCLPCFLNQALKCARNVAPENEEIHRKILVEWATRFKDLDLTQPPPALAGELYSDIASLINVYDPFQEEKLASNRQALKLLPDLEKIVQNSRDPLAAALEISIIGNYIDSGVDREFNWVERLHSEDRQIDPDSYNLFANRVKTSDRALILGDNAGEIVLDTLLVRELQKRDCEVTYAVREKPIINDATYSDAEYAGLDQICEVISSGVDTPGTVLPKCNPEFKDRMRQTPFIISKGQGNFEALLNEWPGIFFAFKVKCSVIERATGHPVGRSILMYQ